MCSFWTPQKTIKALQFFVFHLIWHKSKDALLIVFLQIIMPWGKLGQVPKCPACDKSVYPVEQVFAADRKPFHRSCIQCQVRGCRFGYGDIIGSLSIRWFISNQLTAKGLHKHEGYNFCDWCHETLYVQKVIWEVEFLMFHVLYQEYGPGPGGETIEERRLREQRELEERERKLREIEEMRNKKVFNS